MTHARMTIVLVVSLAFALLAAAAFAPPVAATTVNYTLYGGRGAAAPGTGWSFNDTLLSIPGPNLTATVGETVVITVNATDGRAHSWYLDYNNSGTWDTAVEPGADFPNATGAAVTFSFAADRNGTFQYRSSHKGDVAMVGTFIISPASGLLGDNTVLVIAGSVVIIVAVLAFAAFFWRRMKTPPPPKKE
ncbi:MAG TPA: hypothetical protein VF992_01125 [Thermoplasmata archaeon]